MASKQLFVGITLVGLFLKVDLLFCIDVPMNTGVNQRDANSRPGDFALF